MKGNLSAQTRDHIIYLSGSGKLAIKKGNWKFIDGLGSCGFSFPHNLEPLKNGPEGQLYNMADDVMETNNLYLSEPEKVEELKGLLESYVDKGYSR